MLQGNLTTFDHSHLVGLLSSKWVRTINTCHKMVTLHSSEMQVENNITNCKKMIKFHPFFPIITKNKQAVTEVVPSSVS